MKSGLYRIEVHANFLNDPNADRTNLPEPENHVMLTGNHGITFAKLHRLQIVAKPEKKDPGPCELCEILKGQDFHAVLPDKSITTEPVKYCPRCGRPIFGEEAQE